MAWKPASLALVLLTAFALGLAAPAGAFDRGYLSPGIFSRGPVRGVALLARTSARRARVTVSLHGLDSSKSYVVGWYSKPCSKREDPPTASSSVSIYSMKIEHEGFITRPIAFRSALTAARSVRIWDKEHVLSCTAAAPRPAIIGVLIGAVKGIAAVIAAGNEGNAHGYFSLHGLEPDTDYRVVGSRKPCSQPHTAAARMFSHDLRTAEGQTHLNISFNYKKTTGEYAVRSVRVLTRLPGGQPTQVACGITASYTDAGRVTYY